MNAIPIARSDAAVGRASLESAACERSLNFNVTAKASRETFRENSHIARCHSCIFVHIWRAARHARKLRERRRLTGEAKFIRSPACIHKSVARESEETYLATPRRGFSRTRLDVALETEKKKWNRKEYERRQTNDEARRGTTESINTCFSYETVIT